MKMIELKSLLDEAAVECAMHGHHENYGTAQLEPRLHGQLKWAMMQRFKRETGKSWFSVKAEKP